VTPAAVSVASGTTGNRVVTEELTRIVLRLMATVVP
jgi:hypothetical protein